MSEPNDLVRELREAIDVLSIAKMGEATRDSLRVLLGRAADELERVRAEKEVYISKLATERDLRCKDEQRARDAEARLERAWDKGWRTARGPEPEFLTATSLKAIEDAKAKQRDSDLASLRGEPEERRD